MVKVENTAFFTSGEERDAYLQKRRELAIHSITDALEMIDANTHVAHLLEDALAHIERDYLKNKIAN